MGNGMGSKAKKAAMRTVANAPPLITALNQSEQVKDKVEECALELSAINQALGEEVAAPLPLEQIKHALHQSQQVEVKVLECADDLSVVNQALSEEITERKKLEHRLLESKIELADARAELSDTQVQEKQARHLALHDVVTGLPNRTLFNDRLDNALAQAERHARSLAVMFIDLDKFKAINDSRGHDAGDRVLKIVSERLQASVREEDTVARQGGDEFLYLMLETKNDVDVENAARKIIENIGQPCEIDGNDLTVKPSIGIALYPQHGITAGALLKNADGAMYKAKQSDKGFWFCSPGNGGQAPCS